MAGNWGEADNPLLSGLFGVLQQGAVQRQTTSEVWSSLRQAAGTYAWQVQGGGELPSPAELEATGARILAEQGIGIREVNTYRAVAGEWLGARQALAKADEGQQLGASEIFQPPWARTDESGVDPRYRVRVNWQITPAEGDVYTKWSSYELTSPVTTIEDVLSQAGSKAAGDRYLYLLSGGAPLQIADYEIEQI